MKQETLSVITEIQGIIVVQSGIIENEQDPLEKLWARGYRAGLVTARNLLLDSE